VISFEQAAPYESDAWAAPISAYLAMIERTTVGAVAANALAMKLDRLGMVESLWVQDAERWNRDGARNCSINPMAKIHHIFSALVRQPASITTSITKY